MTRPTRILVVEDEGLLRNLYVATLAAAGFVASGASDVPAARAALAEERPDVVLIDLGLPGIDGLSFARELRGRRDDIGIIVVSRKHTPEIRIEALEAGCDDYLVKPVHLGELCARVQAVARRRAAPQRTRLGTLAINHDARSVTADGNPVHLTRGEFTILAMLAGAEGRIVDRNRLSALVSRHGDDGDLRTVDALVHRIRRKLEPYAADLIVTVPGLGYRLSDMSEPD